MADTAAPADTGAVQPLDDVLLAMDVVDTIRHRERMIDAELDAEGREAELIERLKEIYQAQGIDVPERILKDGVKALEDRRFFYQPPETSLQVRLAKIYVSRDRWLKPAAGAVVAALAGFGIWQVGFVGPARAKAQAERVALAETIPAELASLRETVQEAAAEPRARRLAESYYQDGMAAAASDDKPGAEAARDSLRALREDLAQTYEVRVVYAGGQQSGFFRIPDDAPGARNYYLIVEAITPSGQKAEVSMTSEETQETRRVVRWGQRVSKAVFDRVAADKRDDQIIQSAVIGAKPAGRITPEFEVDTPGGAVFEW